MLLRCCAVYVVCSAVSVVSDDKKATEDDGEHEIRWLSDSRSCS